MACYDTLSEVYDLWVRGDPSSGPCEEFYRKLCLSLTGTLMEIGVGTGRIALGLAESGRHLIGIDVSTQMLRVCNREARQRGLSGMLNLCAMDARNLGFRNIDLITLPFRTLGHFTTHESRRKVFQEIFRALAPGGKFVLDHYVPDIAWAKAYNTIPRLMYRSNHEREGGLLIWDTYCYDFVSGMMDCLVTIERVDKAGMKISCRHTAFLFAWVYPEEIRLLAKETGFVVEALYGTFECCQFSDGSDEQVWVLRKD